MTKNCLVLVWSSFYFFFFFCVWLAHNNTGMPRASENATLSALQLLSERRREIRRLLLLLLHPHQPPPRTNKTNHTKCYLFLTLLLLLFFLHYYHPSAYMDNVPYVHINKHAYKNNMHVMCVCINISSISFHIIIVWMPLYSFLFFPLSNFFRLPPSSSAPPPTYFLCIMVSETEWIQWRAVSFLWCHTEDTVTLFFYIIKVLSSKKTWRRRRRRRKKDFAYSINITPLLYTRSFFFSYFFSFSLRSLDPSSPTKI